MRAKITLEREDINVKRFTNIVSNAGKGVEFLPENHSGDRVDDNEKPGIRRSPGASGRLPDRNHRPATRICPSDGPHQHDLAWWVRLPASAPPAGPGPAHLGAGGATPRGPGWDGG